MKSKDEEFTKLKKLKNCQTMFVINILKYKLKPACHYGPYER